MQLFKSVLAALVLTFGNAMPAVAGLADHFRAFVLGPEAQARPVEARDVRLDAIAQGCLQCHDGSRASHVSARRAGTPMPIRGAQTLNHPVGMEYDRSVSKNPQGYQARATLHPNIRLVDGQVSCVSCHQTRAALTLATAGETPPLPDSKNACTATKELTVGRRDRDLCLACHIK